MATIERTLSRYLLGLDATLLLFAAALTAVGLATVFSATLDTPARFNAQVVNFMLATAIMLVVVQLPPRWLESAAVPLYVLGVLLLIGVAVAGDVVNGARRWLNLGFGRFQPSEMMKIAVPLMLAVFYSKVDGVITLRHHAAAALLLAIPVALIVRQPDLGTAILVAAAGFFVIYFAGIGWKLLFGLSAVVLGSLPFLWNLLHDYQRRRVLTLLDPTSDPLGAGYHIIQATIAVGSGGVAGKGWLTGSQAHLDFIPERHTDFIFAVFAEEWGLIGCTVLVLLYAGLILRGLAISANAPTLMGRLLAGSISLIFFTYAFVNMGMVSGILPVVGVPLPFVSYGGTALVTLFMGLGLLANIHRQRLLVQEG